jgi:hypothetical protein
MTLEEDPPMADLEEDSTLSPDEMADLEEVCRLVSAGKRVTDPELLKRVRQRSDALQRGTLAKYGLIEWAAELMDEGGDDEASGD